MFNTPITPTYKTRLLFGLLLMIGLLSCGKEKDESPPGLNISAPVEGQVKNFLDVNFTFGDYHLASMDISINKSSDNSVLFSRHNTYSTVQNDSFSQGFTLSALGLTATTQVKVNITVTDEGRNVTSKTINCTITP
mgnify:CR=1 FL=1